MLMGPACVQLHVLWCQGELPLWTEMSIYICGEGTVGEGDELLPKCSTIKRKTVSKTQPGLSKALIISVAFYFFLFL